MSCADLYMTNCPIPTASPTPGASTTAPLASSGSGNWMIDQAMGGLAKMIGDAAAGFMQWVWGGVNAGTSVNLSAAPDRFLKLLAGTVAIGLVIALGAFVWEVASATLHGGDLPRIGAAAKGSVLAVVGPIVAVTVVNLMLSASDQITNGIIDIGMGGNLGGVTAMVSAAGPATGVLATMGLGVLWIAIAFCQWVMLTITAALIWIEMMFLPIAFSGAANPAMRPWVGKWIGMSIGCVLAKPVMLLVTAIGLSLVDASTATASPQHLGMGIVVMALSVLAPFTVMQQLSIAGESIGAAGTAGGAAGRGLHPSRAANAARFLFKK